MTKTNPPFSTRWPVSLIDLLLVAIGLSLTLALLAHAYVGYFTRYMADDYCTAASIRTGGLLLTQKNFYLGWSGRFSFTFVAGILAMVGVRIVPFLPALALSLITGALTWAIYPFLRDSQRRPLLISCLLAELVVVVAVSDNRGGVYEALYWQTGMLTYWVPLILIVAGVGLLKRASDETKQTSASKRQLALFVALTFVAGGFNETYAVFQVCLLLLALAWCLWRAVSKLTPLLGAGLVGAAASLIIVALAPGNSVRQAQFPEHPAWLPLTKSAAASAFNFVFFEQNYPNTFYFRALALLLPGLAAIYVTRSGGERLGPLHVSQRPKGVLTLAVLPLVTFALIMACFAPAMWAMSKQPPPRALIIPEFVLVGLTVIWSYSAGLFLKHAFLDGRSSYSLLAAVSLALALGLTLLPVIASRNTLGNASRAARLARLWDKQDQEIRAARTRGETELRVSVAYNIGGTDLMTADPKWYVNQCLAEYYGVKTVTAIQSLDGLRIMTDTPDR
ncbi:MAG: DUF6056 family protein [Acidobacteriota bacterium]